MFSDALSYSDIQCIYLLDLTVPMYILLCCKQAAVYNLDLVCCNDDVFVPEKRPFLLIVSL